jgi:electron transfer flavoprotein alpha subunit
LRVAALIKQVPAGKDLTLDRNGVLVRGTAHEMSPFCRRAVTQAVLLARATGGRSLAMTMGPPSAMDVLREAVACGIDDAVHLCDPALAGSDTLITARALVAAIDRAGPFDLVLLGRGSADSETGSVGPQIAQLMGLPFAGPVRTLTVSEDARHVEVDVELDDGTQRLRIELPAVLATAERLCRAAKCPAEMWPDAIAVRRYAVCDLGVGPWGLTASPTRVDMPPRLVGSVRAGTVLAGDLRDQVRSAIDGLVDRGAFSQAEAPAGRVPPARSGGRPVVVLAGPHVDTEVRALLGTAARLATETAGHVVAIGGDPCDTQTLGAWGADTVLLCARHAPTTLVERLGRWARQTRPWAVLAPATPWGREVAARLAVAEHAGLIADALDVSVRDGRLIGDKPAFAGQLSVDVYCVSAVQCATVRPGTLPLLVPRQHEPHVERLEVPPEPRIVRLGSRVNDPRDALARAPRVVGVGRGVHKDDYPLLDPLLEVLDAELGATRKVTDQGWLPHSRQIGTTGRAVAPRLFVALGISGAAHHTAGIRGAGSVLAVNADPTAPVFAAADAGIVADWREVVPMLVDECVSRGLGRRGGA